MDTVFISGSHFARVPVFTVPLPPIRSVSGKKRVDAYLEALFKEIDFVAEHFKDKVLDTIYIGGGTPTSLSADQLDRLLTKIEESLDLSGLLEFTVEAGKT